MTTMTATMVKTDSQVQQDVLRELRWDTRVSETEVGGYKRYPGGHYHIDNGPRRTW